MLLPFSDQKVLWQYLIVLLGGGLVGLTLELIRLTPR